MTNDLDATSVRPGFHDTADLRCHGFVAIESATAIPTTIFPAYVGSGHAMLGLDASGLQGLNHGVQHAFGGEVGNSGDLYLVRSGFVSDVLSEGNLHPMGYFDWSLSIGDRTIDATNVVTEAALWTRRLDLTTGLVRTRMLVAERVWLDLAVAMPFGLVAPTITVTLTRHELPMRPAYRDWSPASEVECTVTLRLATRDNRPLFDSVVPADGALILTTQEGLRTSVRPLGAPAELSSEAIAIHMRADLGCDDSVTNTIGFAFDEAAGTMADLLALNKASEDGWTAFWSDSAVVHGLDPVERYLFTASQYLMRAGVRPEHGITTGMPFSHPPAWRASTFWDSHFVVDAWLAAGRTGAAIEFLRFLNSSMRPEGRPFAWMVDYLGRATIDPARDAAPLVVAAHAMTAIKVAEYLPDDALLADLVVPVCRRAADWAADGLFERDGDEWITRAVSHDVIDGEPEELNQTFTTVWFVVVLAKTLEYAERLGMHDVGLDRLRDIVAHHRLEVRDGEYLHSVGVSAEDHPMASYVPFLLYPTEATPFIDTTFFDRSRELYDFVELYRRKQGDFQPWPALMQAHNDLRRGAPRTAEAGARRALDAVHGPGYFTEIGPQQETVGLPPYLTAHGSFVSYQLARVVSYSLWEPVIGLFTNVASGRTRWSLERVRVPGGVIIDAEYDGALVRARFAGVTTPVTVWLPALSGGDNASVDGSLRAVASANERAVAVTIGAGESELVYPSTLA